MAAYRGGERVKAGFFFNLDSWEITTITGREGGTLAGDATARFLRVPVLGMLALAPLMGAVFAMFLPFIGIFMVAKHVAGRSWVGLQHLAHAAVGTFGPAWQPNAAYLTGSPEDTKAKKDDKASPTEAALDSLEKEIETRESDESTQR